MDDTLQLKAVYNLKKDSINSRLSDFRKFYSDSVSWFYNDNKMALRPVQRNNDERIFEELVFCLLTANTSAVMGMKAVDSVRPVLMNGTVADIRDALVKAGYRYPNARAQYLFEARENLKKKYALGIRKIIESQADTKELREFFVNEIKGLGYKEASHFLRNIGILGLAILDKHILRTLYEYGMIKEMPNSLNKKKYLDYEQKFIEFAGQLNINMDELDLLLWSMKNGQIMK
jgi:N-glycosylase/DNA lyase